MLKELHTLDDFERAARETLSPGVYDYFRGGADTEVTLRANRDEFAKYELWYRTFHGVAEPNLSTTIAGQAVDFPVLVAPCAFHGLAHSDAEIGAARASNDLGTLFVLSMFSTTSLEAVAASTPGPKWFHIVLLRDRGMTRELVARAHDAGYSGIVLTVDSPIHGRRVADLRNAFSVPEHFTLPNLAATGTKGLSLGEFIRSRVEPSFTLADLESLVSGSRLPIIVKGIVRADDAVGAVSSGARGVIVSNHGGRQLDRSPAALSALPAIVSAVDGRAEVMMDGGVRFGTDVLVALGLGAKAVLIGRPVLWGLAVNGYHGVRCVLELIRDETKRAATLAGCATAEAIREHQIVRIRDKT